MIPRIRGSAIQKENGKWTFFLLISTLGQDENTDEYNFNYDFDTQAEAIAELKKAAQIVSEEYERQITGSVSGKYIDMKTNSTRPWSKNEEH